MCCTLFRALCSYFPNSERNRPATLPPFQIHTHGRVRVHLCLNLSAGLLMREPSFLFSSLSFFSSFNPQPPLLSQTDCTDSSDFTTAFAPLGLVVSRICDRGVLKKPALGCVHAGLSACVCACTRVTHQMGMLGFVSVAYPQSCARVCVCVVQYPCV